jgi:menaquinone-dependent protoporphyrinogen IX oxidase
MTAFTVHSSKDGKTVQTVRLGPATTVAKALALHSEGWQVHITDALGRRFDPADFDQVLGGGSASAPDLV